MNDTYISIVIPVFNEALCVKELYEKNISVLKKINKSFEIILVDDGSTDNSLKIMKELALADNRIKVIVFRKNFGQTAALDAGLKASSGKVIVTMDADLQNDPSDIPRLLEELDKGFDCISGWRYPRRDSFLRNSLSWLADKLRHFIINDSIHDSGCTLKAFKRECFDNLNLYGEMHRFIPAILSCRGFKIGEIKVKHFPRKKGRTKYNHTRIIKGLLDLLLLRFWMSYSARPIHLFGVIGAVLLMLGFSFGSYLTILKFCFHVALAGRPLLFLTVLLFTVGAQFIVFGILADIMVQIYYSSGGKQAYNIMETIN